MNRDDAVKIAASLFTLTEADYSVLHAAYGDARYAMFERIAGMISQMATAIENTERARDVHATYLSSRLNAHVSSVEIQLELITAHRDALLRAIDDYPSKNPHQFQAAVVCSGITQLAFSYMKKQD
jgi:hypothetical protein